MLQPLMRQAELLTRPSEPPEDPHVGTGPTSWERVGEGPLGDFSVSSTSLTRSGESTDALRSSAAYSVEKAPCPRMGQCHSNTNSESASISMASASPCASGPAVLESSHGFMG